MSYFDVESYSLHPHLGKKDFGFFFPTHQLYAAASLTPCGLSRFLGFLHRRGAGDDFHRFLLDAMGAMMVDDGALARSRPQARFRLLQGPHQRWGCSLAAPSRGQRPGLGPHWRRHPARADPPAPARAAPRWACAPTPPPGSAPHPALVPGLDSLFHRP